MASPSRMIDVGAGHMGLGQDPSGRIAGRLTGRFNELTGGWRDFDGSRDRHGADDRYDARDRYDRYDSRDPYDRCDARDCAIGTTQDPCVTGTVVVAALNGLVEDSLGEEASWGEEVFLLSQVNGGARKERLATGSWGGGLRGEMHGGREDGSELSEDETWVRW